MIPSIELTSVRSNGQGCAAVNPAVPTCPSQPYHGSSCDQTHQIVSSSLSGQARSIARSALPPICQAAVETTIRSAPETTDIEALLVSALAATLHRYSNASCPIRFTRYKTTSPHKAQTSNNATGASSATTAANMCRRSVVQMVITDDQTVQSVLDDAARLCLAEEVEGGTDGPTCAHEEAVGEGVGVGAVSNDKVGEGVGVGAVSNDKVGEEDGDEIMDLTCWLRHLEYASNQTVGNSKCSVSGVFGVGCANSTTANSSAENHGLNKSTKSDDDHAWDHHPCHEMFVSFTLVHNNRHQRTHGDGGDARESPTVVAVSYHDNVLDSSAVDMFLHSLVHTLTQLAACATRFVTETSSFGCASDSERLVSDLSPLPITLEQHMVQWINASQLDQTTTWQQWCRHNLVDRTHLHRRQSRSGGGTRLMCESRGCSQRTLNESLPSLIASVMERSKTNTALIIDSVREWHSVRRDVPAFASLWRACKERSGITCGNGAMAAGVENTMTYSEMDLMTSLIGSEVENQLKSIPFLKDIPIVAIRTRRNVVSVLISLSLARIGCAYMPIDATCSEGRLLAMLDTVDVDLVLVDDPLMCQHLQLGPSTTTNNSSTPCWKEKVKSTVTIERVMEESLNRLRNMSLPSHGNDSHTGSASHSLSTDYIRSQLHNDQTQQRLRRLHASSLSHVMFTSGSTNVPKAVAIPHRGVVRMARQPNYCSVSAEDVFLQLSCLSFDGATFEIWMSLLNGSKLVFADSERATTDLDEMHRLLSSYEVSSLIITSNMVRLMVDFDITLFQNVRQVITGAEVLSKATSERMLSEMPSCRLINCYGPTENTVFATYCHVTRDILGYRTIPIGRPISHTYVFVLDRNCRHVPIGVEGEVYIAGAGVAKHYIGAPEATRASFLHCPFSEMLCPMYANSDGLAMDVVGDVMYRTGDVAEVLPNGMLNFRGRRDKMVKINGVRIDLSSIEDVITKQFCTSQVASTVLSRGKTQKICVYVCIWSTQADVTVCGTCGTAPNNTTNTINNNNSNNSNNNNSNNNNNNTSDRQCNPSRRTVVDNEDDSRPTHRRCLTGLPSDESQTVVMRVLEDTLSRQWFSALATVRVVDSIPLNRNKKVDFTAFFQESRTVSAAKWSSNAYPDVGDTTVDTTATNPDVGDATADTTATNPDVTDTTATNPDGADTTATNLDVGDASLAPHGDGTIDRKHSKRSSDRHTFTRLSALVLASLQEVLGIDTEELRPQCNLMEIGISSLEIVKFVTSMRRRLSDWTTNATAGDGATAPSHKVDEEENQSKDLQLSPSHCCEHTTASPPPHFVTASPPPHFVTASPPPHFVTASPPPHFVTATDVYEAVTIADLVELLLKRSNEATTLRGSCSCIHGDARAHPTGSSPSHTTYSVMENDLNNAMEALQETISNAHFRHRTPHQKAFSASPDGSSLPRRCRSHVFLTGATGLLGNTILIQLLRRIHHHSHRESNGYHDETSQDTDGVILSSDSMCYCLVRGQNAKETKDRLKLAVRKRWECYDRHSTRSVSGGVFGVDGGDNARIDMDALFDAAVEVVVGDVEKPHFGLSDEKWSDLVNSESGIGTIIHCAARVDFVRPYSSLRRANVFGTLHALQLCIPSDSNLRNDRLVGVSSSEVTDESVDYSSQNHNNYTHNNNGRNHVHSNGHINGAAKSGIYRRFVFASSSSVLASTALNGAIAFDSPSGVPRATNPNVRHGQTSSQSSRDGFISAKAILKGMCGGYAQSKCVSEQLVMSASESCGIPCRVFRLDDLVDGDGNSTDGNTTFLSSFVASVRHVRTVPSSFEGRDVFPMGVQPVASLMTELLLLPSWLAALPGGKASNAPSDSHLIVYFLSPRRGIPLSSLWNVSDDDTCSVPTTSNVPLNEWISIVVAAAEHGVATNRDTDGVATNRDEDGVATNRDTDGVATNRDTDGVATNRDKDGVATNRDEDGVATNRDTDGVATNRENDGKGADERDPSGKSHKYGIVSDTRRSPCSDLLPFVPFMTDAATAADPNLSLQFNAIDDRLEPHRASSTFIHSVCSRFWPRPHVTVTAHNTEIAIGRLVRSQLDEFGQSGQPHKLDEFGQSGQPHKFDQSQCDALECQRVGAEVLMSMVLCTPSTISPGPHPIP